MKLEWVVCSKLGIYLSHWRHVTATRWSGGVKNLLFILLEPPEAITVNDLRNSPTTDPSLLPNMQNLRTTIQTSLPHASPPPTQTLVSEGTLYTLHPHPPTLHTTSLAHPNTPVKTSLPEACTTFARLDDRLLLASRTGALHSVSPLPNPAEPDTKVRVEHVADVTDEDVTRSGILALASSPDLCLLAVVSPVNVTLLNSELDCVSEIPCEDVASHAEICWRVDGECFVVVRRTSEGVSGTVYDRGCETARKLKIDAGCDGLCVSTTWEPRAGGLIAIAGPEKNVSFFERNGERHLRSDFESEGNVVSLSWGYGGVLGVLQEDGVGFWKRDNYVWKRKKWVDGGVVDVIWDEDDVSLAHVVMMNGHVVRIRFDQVVDTLQPGVVGVVDGCQLSVTNLGKALIPPPLCHMKIHFGDDIEAVCDGGVLRCDGVFEKVCIDWDTGSVARRERWELEGWDVCGGGILTLRMPVLRGDMLAVIRKARVWHGEEEPVDSVCFYHLESGAGASVIAEHTLDGRVCATGASVMDGCVLVALLDGTVVRVGVEREAVFVGACVKSGAGGVVEICETRVGRREMAFVRGGQGSLRVVEMESGKMVKLCEECTSFVLHEGFVLFTTRSHVLYCMQLDSRAKRAYKGSETSIPSLVDVFDSISGTGAIPEGQGATRPIDRGSILIAGVPQDVSIVLQAPRGNLECVAPRPLVFEAVDRDAKEGLYEQAFKLCRRQRVDMNHIVEADRERFLREIDRFVDDVGKEGDLCVFLTFVKGDEAGVNAICDAVVQAIGRREDADSLVNGVITGLIRRSPRDVDGALRVVRDLRGRNEEAGAKAVDYMFVVTKDENAVYEHALGLYDVNFAGFVAEKSGLDPGEFRGVLQRLARLGEMEMKYEIDMMLGRFEDAVRHLFECGRERWDECVRLCHEHKTYETGLDVFTDSEIVKELKVGYAKYLRSKERWIEAAEMFVQVEEFHEASTCYSAGGMWEYAVWCVKRSGKEEDADARMEGISETLVESGKAGEAARVEIMMGRYERAVEICVNAELWETAVEVVGAHDEGGVLLDDVRRGVGEARDGLVGMARDNCAKLAERRVRLEAVREMKRAFAAGRSERREEETESEVFSSSTASSVGSHMSDLTFTSRGSATTSVYSGMTGMLSEGRLEKAAERRRRKQDRKRIRQGHPREEEALVATVRRLVPGEFVVRRVERCVRALRVVGVAEAGVVDALRRWVEEAGRVGEEDVVAQRVVVDWSVFGRCGS